MRNRREAHMLLHGRLQILRQVIRKSTRCSWLPSFGRSKRVQDRCLQIKNQTRQSSLSSYENLSDLCKRFKVRDILIATSRVTNVGMDEVLSDRRSPDYVLARHITMYLSFKYTGYSFPKIGHILSRDHSTIIYGVKKITRLLKTNNNLQETIYRIEKELDGKK